MWLKRFYSNHVIANLTFLLILVLGIQAFMQMPRAREPEVNFNYVIVATILPGASAEEIERRVTEPLENAIATNINDLDFVSSTSRESVSSILVRFTQIDEAEFDKHMIDLRREVQNTYTDELPVEADDPLVRSITTSNGMPVAAVVVRSLGRDENLLVAGRNIKNELERIRGVDDIDVLGLPDPELHISFIPERLEGLGITPADLADTVRGYFRDVSMGDLETANEKWVIRFQGTESDPALLAEYPIVTASGIVTLGSVAELSLSYEEISDLVSHQGRPAVMLSVKKQGKSNELELLGDIRQFVYEYNKLTSETGIELFLVDDQTAPTEEALSLMQNNLSIGLILVLLVTWAFLGGRIALLTCIGIPLTICGTFIILRILDMTVNTSVLLGVVIALGMIVDDAVVVVEAIYYRLKRGARPLEAAVDSLREVFAPVTTSVLTTIAAFAPLLMLPGILGDFMRVIPITVCVALLVSLIEAYWMLPVHISSININFEQSNRMHLWRTRMTQWIRIRYSVLLLKALRYPIKAMGIILLAFSVAMGVIFSGLIKFDFFATGELRIFYLSVELPRDARVEQSLSVVEQIEAVVRRVTTKEELRGTVSYAGQRFTETEQLYGENVGQVMVSLRPEGRRVAEIARLIEDGANKLDLGAKISKFIVTEGPPVLAPVSIKVRGINYEEIMSAVTHLTTYMEKQPEFTDISIDYQPGNKELVLKLNGDAIKRAGLSPSTVTRSLQAYVDGEIVSQFQDKGEEVNVRVLAKRQDISDISALLRQSLSLPDGRSIPIGELVTTEYGQGQQNIRHYNFRRAVTIDSEINRELIDTVKANQMVLDEWQSILKDFPNLSIDLTGELDDIEESLDAIYMLAAMGIGLIYLIIGTQFASYWQPFMVLATVPLAITGVVYGTLVTGFPMSLYTMYGVVALLGISVNSAIVLISAANDRLRWGMSVLHATVYAARRRVIPILITSFTTIAGLFSLAAGLAGDSVLWSPVASAIVSGLAFSTLLTLFLIPLLYRIFMVKSHLVHERHGEDPLEPSDESAPASLDPFFRPRQL